MDSYVVVRHRAEERVWEGHLWIYRSDVAEVAASAGDIVRVVGARGRVVGRAFYSDQSEIALRMLTTTDEPIDRRWWRQRIESALAYRSTLPVDATAWRAVHGESDRLPSIIIDRYADYVVLQTLSQGAEQALPELIAVLKELLEPAGILARNDARVRQLEGLPREVKVLHGEVPPSVVVREGAVEYEADLSGGQKTGLFLDQRENRMAAASYARGRALDCFTYHGGFALHLAQRADSVMAIDVSEDATAVVARNAARNGLTNIEPRTDNVFDALRELERSGERFDTIVLDPPAFAKNKRAVENALAGYKEINLRALRLLTVGGHLITCTCSYHVDEPTFIGLIHSAAVDTQAQVTLVEKRTQSRDHPILLGVPETFYLKCLIVRKVGTS